MALSSSKLSNVSKTLGRAFARTLVASSLVLAAGCSSERDGNGEGHQEATAAARSAVTRAGSALVHQRGGKDLRTLAKRVNRVKNGVPGRYIVVLDAPALGISSAARGQRPQSVVAKLAGKHAFRQKHVYQQAIKGFSAEMDPDEAAALAQDPDVAYVVEDATVHHTAVQANPPWHLDRIDQRDLPGNASFATSGTGRGVNAYVVDTGVVPNHEELAGRATIGADFVGDGRKGVDCNGHGTHVAGIIAGKTFGVAKEARVHAVRVLDCNGSGFVSDIMAGLEWVEVNAVKPAVVNMSLGGSAFPEFDAVVREVIAAGIPVVVAAGNDGYFAEEFSPPRVTEAITVGAINSLDMRTEFSNFGSVVDVFAPGEGVPSAWFATTNASAALSGTSMASPVVAGSVALYLEANPTATPAAVEAAVVASSTRGKVKDAGPGSPNRLIFSGLTAPALRPALFVVGSTTLPPDDSALSARLSALGYSLTIKTGAALVAGDATGKAVVVVSSSADSAAVGSKLTNVTVPVVSLEGYIFDDLKMTGATLNVDYGQVTTPTVLEVRDDQQALSAGLRGTNQNGVWDHLVQPSSAGGRYWGVPAASAVGLDGRPVTLQGQPGRASVFGYEPGAVMVGLTAPARRVGFFADQAAVRAFTAEGWALFDAAVEWAAAPVTDAPMARSLAVGPSPNRVDLRWIGNDIPGIQHDILRGARPGGPYTKIATSSTAGTEPYNGMAIYAYTDNTAVTGQTYYYVVSPLLGGRNGRSSREARASLGLPEAPWVVIYYLVDIDGGLINTEVVAYAPNATNLRISRSDSSNGPFTEIATIVNGSPLGNVYDDPTTLPNRTYYYTVQGFNGFGNGATSAPTPSLYDGLSQATPVQNLYARSVPGGARLNWDHVPRASDYRVVATGVNDGQQVFGADLTQPDATLWLPPGQDYHVYVEPGGSWAASSPPSGTVVTVTPGVGSALLVVGDIPLRAGDQRLANELQALGLSVTSKRSVDLLTSDAGGRDLVVVSSTAIPAQVGTKLTSVTAPVLVLEPYVLGQMQMTGGTAGTHFGVAGNQDSLLIDVEHPLAGGATRTTKVGARTGDFGWGIPASSAIGVGRLPGVVPATGSQPRSLFAFEKGATLANGSAAPARRVALLVDADVLSGLTDDARGVLQSVVRWAIDPNAQDPREPSNVTAAPSGSNVNLTWGAVPGASSYVVYRANMAFNEPPSGRSRIADIIATGVTSTSFVDSSPLSGAAYSYYVAAVGASGGSDRSAPFYAGVNVPPARPQSSAAALNGAVRIDMKAGPGAQSLRVLRSTLSGGPYTSIATNLPASTTTYTAGGLTNGVPAYFVVEAVNSTGVSRSLETYGIPRPDLVAPGGLSATASNGQVALGWGAVANAVAYRVGRGDSASSTATEIVAASSTLTFVTDGSAVNGKQYRYFITPLGDADLTGPTVSFTVSPRGKVLFVRASSASAGDVVLRDRLVALGFDVTEKADALLVTADANGQDLVVVSETVTSGNIGTKLTNVAVPVLSLEPSILDDLRMTGLASGTDFGTTAGQTQVNVVDPSLPLAARLLAGTRTANTTGGVYLWGVPGSEALVAARLLSSTTRAVSFGYQRGTPMVGLAAPARRTGLFVDTLTAGSFTADGRALFDAAVSWTAGLR